MRILRLSSLALFALLALSPLALADDKKSVVKEESSEPALIVRLKPLDGLISDLKYLVKQTAREEIAKQVEGLLKGMTGPKGLEGVDTKKPIGLVATPAAKLDQSQVYLLVPISDEKVFLEFLNNIDFKVEKGQDGLHTMTIENVPFPVLFRIAHGYLYATPKYANAVTVPEADKLPKPEALLGKEGGLLTLTAHLDRVPEPIRKVVVSAAALQLGNLKDQDVKGETEAQKALRETILDEATGIVKQVIEEGGPVSLKLDIDQKNHDLSLAFESAGKSGSALAKRIAALGESKGLASLVSKESAFGGHFNVSLPADIIKHLAPVVDEGFKQGLEALDENTRALAKPLVEALEATAKSGTFDGAADLRGPAKNGKYTLVTGYRVKDGDKIESALKKVIDQLPEDAKTVIKLDADKANGVNIHRVTQTKVDENTKDLLGDGPLYVAISKDALIATAGENALEAIKEALAAKPTVGGPMRLEVSLARLAPLIAKTRKNAVEISKKAFAEKDSDKVTFSVGASKGLEVKVRVKTAVLAFAALLDAEEKKEK